MRFASPPFRGGEPMLFRSSSACDVEGHVRSCHAMEAARSGEVWSAVVRGSLMPSRRGKKRRQKILHCLAARQAPLRARTYPASKRLGLNLCPPGISEAVSLPAVIRCALAMLRRQAIETPRYGEVLPARLVLRPGYPLRDGAAGDPFRIVCAVSWPLASAASTVPMTGPA
jgi:hypothetical protein